VRVFLRLALVSVSLSASLYGLVGSAAAAETPIPAKPQVTGHPVPPLQEVISEVGDSPAHRSEFGGFTLNPDGTATVQMTGAIPQFTATLTAALPPSDLVNGAVPSSIVKVTHRSLLLSGVRGR